MFWYHQLGYYIKEVKRIYLENIHRRDRRKKVKKLFLSGLFVPKKTQIIKVAFLERNYYITSPEWE